MSASEVQKQLLLDEFASYLETVDFDQQPIQEQPDLFSLLTEMATLKVEVKTQSRHFKTTLDRYNDSLAALQKNNQTLLEQIDTQQSQLSQRISGAEQAMLLQLLDVYDRLVEGQKMLHTYKPVNSLFNHSKKKDLRFIKSIRKGQDMSITRLQQLLNTYQVKRIEAKGEKFDPLSMIAVATQNNKKFAQGIVLEEIRDGFYIGSKVLRLAEVKVNRLMKPNNIS